MPRPTVAPVALVTVRARRMRVFPTPLESPAPGPDLSGDLSGDLVVAELEAFEVPAPAPRPRHTPPAKISLKDVPSGMEQLAERWRGAP